MKTIRLIADDLTGALDSAVPFTARVPGLPVLLARDSGGIELAAHASAAISIGSRDLDPRAAAGRATAAAPFLKTADIAFLKMDSLLRGNWPVELARLSAECPERTCLFAPAFPAERRITEEGRQVAPGPDGRMAPLARVPLDALAAAGLRARVVAVGAMPHPDPGGALICDARRNEDLKAIVAWARAMNEPMLWCGSAGLAHALSGEAAPPIALKAARPLVVAGSQHPLTLAQIAAVPREAALRVAIGADAAESAARIARDIAKAPCIATVDLPPGRAASDAAAVVAQRLAAVLPRLGPPTRLVVIGGETLLAVCGAIGAEALYLEGEWREGVPCSRVSGGMWDGVPLISRSGAFGRRDFLNELFGAAADHAGTGKGTPAEVEFGR